MIFIDKSDFFCLERFNFLKILTSQGFVGGGVGRNASNCLLKCIVAYVYNTILLHI